MARSTTTTSTAPRLSNAWGNVQENPRENSVRETASMAGAGLSTQENRGHKTGARTNAYFSPQYMVQYGYSDEKTAPRPLVLVGLQAIGTAVGVGPQALRRWIREEQFPARRCSDGIFRADPEAVRLWFRQV